MIENNNWNRYEGADSIPSETHVLVELDTRIKSARFHVAYNMRCMDGTHILKVGHYAAHQEEQILRWRVINIT